MNKKGWFFLRNQPFYIRLKRGLVFAHHAHFFTQAPLGFFLFTLALDAGLFVEFALLHFTEEPFLLQLALENPDGFLDIIVDHMDLHLQSPRFPEQIIPRREGYGL